MLSRAQALALAIGAPGGPAPWPGWTPALAVELEDAGSRRAVLAALAWLRRAWLASSSSRRRA
jgi:hypothetical protein